MDLNRLLSSSLRVGVLASVVLCLAGLVAWGIQGYANIPPVSGPSVGTAVASVLTGAPSGLVYLAIVLLIATPVLRVALSTVYFANAGDKKYVVITLAVLAMLLFALLSGYSA